MDFTKALTYPFDDEEWLQKLGIAAGIGLLAFIFSFMLIGIVAFIPLAGWGIETMKRVKAGNPRPLAGWDDFGGLFSSGLTPVLGWLVYQIPTLIVYCISLSIFMLPALGGDNSDATAVLAGVSFIGYCCICVILIYAIAAGIVYWGGLIRYLDRPEFGTFMAFGDNIALVRENSSDFGMAFLFVLIGGLVSSVIAGIPCIGWIVYVPFQFYYSSHIIGQLAAKVSGVSPVVSPTPQV